MSVLSFDISMTTDLVFFFEAHCKGCADYSAVQRGRTWPLFIQNVSNYVNWNCSNKPEAANCAFNEWF